MEEPRDENRGTSGPTPPVSKPTPPKEFQFKPGQSGNPKGRPPDKLLKAKLREIFENNPDVVENMLKSWILASRGKSGHARLLKEMSDGREPLKIVGTTDETESLLELRISVVATPALPQNIGQVIDVTPESQDATPQDE